MLPTHFSFVDLETSGARSRFDRVIEIGIVRVENDKIVESFSSLINPEVHIPEDITRLTGIRESDLVHSPSFFEIADKVQELLKDTVFVAHNVRFDYGFLKMEFKRLNKSFTQKHFCTVRLSRALYPQYPRHNLDSLIERMNYTIEKRHRALDDAQVLFHFYKKAKKEFPQEIFESALKKVLQKPYLPIKLSEKTLDDLPESPGVYIFYGSLDNTPSLPS
ncbi:MAG: polymerase subunit epsilon, partial [Patescibacteria group bacterium]|nr:polymerase subunit epsilon [Patescibacteria group bacterium]